MATIACTGRVQALTLTPHHFAALLGLAPYLVEEFQVHAHYLREMASDEKVDDLMKWRWALRGNFWFHQIKAAEMPLCMDDELLRRGAHTRHMSAMRRAASSIAQDAHREREHQQSATNEPLPGGRPRATSPDVAAVARMVAMKRGQARS